MMLCARRYTNNGLTREGFEACSTIANEFGGVGIDWDTTGHSLVLVEGTDLGQLQASSPPKHRILRA